MPEGEFVFGLLLQEVWEEGMIDFGLDLMKEMLMEIKDGGSWELADAQYRGVAAFHVFCIHYGIKNIEPKLLDAISVTLETTERSPHPRVVHFLEQWTKPGDRILLCMLLNSLPKQDYICIMVGKKRRAYKFHRSKLSVLSKTPSWKKRIEMPEQQSCTVELMIKWAHYGLLTFENETSLTIRFKQMALLYKLANKYSQELLEQEVCDFILYKMFLSERIDHKVLAFRPSEKTMWWLLRLIGNEVELWDLAVDAYIQDKMSIKEIGVYRTKFPPSRYPWYGKLKDIEDIDWRKPQVT